MSQEKTSAFSVTVLGVSDIKPLPFCRSSSFPSFMSLMFYPRLFVSVAKGDQRYQTEISERAQSVMWNKTFFFNNAQLADNKIRIELHRKKKCNPDILLDRLDVQLELGLLERGTEIQRKLSNGATINFKVGTISKYERQRIFALVIGINKYKSTKIENLKGCVNDARAMGTFLSSLQVPEANICTLTDEGATREMILSSFQKHLIENPRIEKGDPIIFFFAGHGSRVEAPKEWEASDGQIETICPHDEWVRGKDKKQIPGIPSRTINELFRTLAGAKGNNITAIFDSCHSGAIARLTTTEFAARCTKGCPIKNPDLDADICGAGRSAKFDIPKEFLYESMSSHVLLAACKHEDLAYETTVKEGPYGAFTNALVQTLYSAPLNQITYEELIKCLPSLPNQQAPQCGGRNTKRVLFDEDVSPAVNYRSYFPVRVKQRLGDGGRVEEYGVEEYEVEAGVIHGVSVGTEFRIQSADSSYLGILVAKTVNTQSSILIHRENDSKFQVPLKGARAVISDWRNDELVLKLYVDPQDSLAGFLGPPKTSKGKLQKQSYARVHTKDEADVILRYIHSQHVLEIERTDGIVRAYAQPVIRAPLPKEELKRMPFILDAIVLFQYHLLRSDGAQTLVQDVESLPGVEIYLYLLSKERPRRARGENLFKNNRARVKSSEEKRYGIKITNHTRHSFYPYLFYFDPSDYSIQLLYCPYSSEMNAPLRALQYDEPGQVTVGYGQGGGDPIQFKCDDTPDTGFIKLFLSNVYVDMGHIAQNAAVEAGRRRKMVIKADDYKLWGCSLAVVTVEP